MTVEAILLLTWGLPLTLGLVQLLHLRRLVPVAAFAALPGLLTVLFVPVGTVIEVPSLLLGAQFALDDTGQAFLLFTSVLWLLAGVFAEGYLRLDEKRPRFFAFFLLAMAGNLGLIVAGDMLTFYLFFALMSFSSYGLIIHTQRDEDYYAGRVYLILVVVGEVLLFAALVLIGTSTDTLLFSELAERPTTTLAAALVFISFGIKAGVVFLHTWLPLAHPAAPIPASAVLSGAMIKAGVLGWLRFLHPAEFTAEWSGVLIAVGLLTAFYGAFMGVTQVNPKTVLAYSSISQMGFIIIAVGAWLISVEDRQPALIAVWLYAIHHALAKGALFLGVAFAGASRFVPLILIIPAVALAGLPLTSGAVAKTALKSVTDILPGDWGATLSLPLSMAALGTTLLMVRFLWLIWRSPAPQKRQPSIVWGVWLALVGCAAGMTLILPMATEALSSSLSPSSLWTATVPVLVGAVIGAIIGFASTRVSLRTMPLVPPGDVLIVFVLLWRGGRSALAQLTQVAQQVEAFTLKGLKPLTQVEGFGAAASRIEQRLRTDWLVAGSALLVIALVVLLVIWNNL